MTQHAHQVFARQVQDEMSVEQALARIAAAAELLDMEVRADVPLIERLVAEGNPAAAGLLAQLIAYRACGIVEAVEAVRREVRAVG